MEPRGHTTPDFTIDLGWAPDPSRQRPEEAPEERESRDPSLSDGPADTSGGVASNDAAAVRAVLAALDPRGLFPPDGSDGQSVVEALSAFVAQVWELAERVRSLEVVVGGLQAPLAEVEPDPAVDDLSDGQVVVEPEPNGASERHESIPSDLPRHQDFEDERRPSSEEAVVEAPSP